MNSNPGLASQPCQCPETWPTPPLPVMLSGQADDRHGETQSSEASCLCQVSEQAPRIADDPAGKHDGGGAPAAES